jgi:hypothetical protein
MIFTRLFIFAAVCIAAVYIFSSIVGRDFKKINIHIALLYVSAVAMIGVLGEIFVDTIFARFFHGPLWRYNFLPVHHAYTSEYAPILWGTFGLYLYLMHHKKERWTRQELIRLSIIFALQALIIEAIADLVSKPILGDYIYYYYPGGLWHITAFPNFPFYFLSGYLIIQTIHWFKTSPHYFTYLSTWITAVTIYFR